VTAADVGDRDGATQLLRRLDRRRFPRLRHGWVDGGYRGPFLDWARERRGISFQVVSRHDGGRRRRWLPPGATPPIVSAFAVVPRRWVVERTFAWLGRYRRLSKDYEYLTATSEAVIYLAMTRLLLRRLTRPSPFQPPRSSTQVMPYSCEARAYAASPRSPTRLASARIRKNPSNPPGKVMTISRPVRGTTRRWAWGIPRGRKTTPPGPTWNSWSPHW
jgi:transposase